MFALRGLALDENGGPIVEYALVMALVSVLVMTALTGFGDVLQSLFAQSSSDMTLVATQAK